MNPCSSITLAQVPSEILVPILRACRTLAKHYLKGSEKEAKVFIKLMQQEFSCPNVAKRLLDNFVKT
ncbi:MULTISPECIES: hypothetical protein [unclassified Neochlamydia]|uniref:hypothetical protein n=1 Tax=unclassified Neochlamydia TaxID=2643326 RepID=UPI001BC997F5|nr:MULTISPECIES: hypothetical protein [unclassified Neochlamydia]MBS4166592.1 Uncharacterized protein [Neochlamydia sp. AcF65]MBS4170446.1 Uncharacterized protein [Neochlamydia sp. AcF95]